MKTKYKYIEFNKSIIEDKWLCKNRNEIVLGWAEYNIKWKEWEFCPNDNMAFTIECLHDIADFIEQLNKDLNK